MSRGLGARLDAERLFRGQVVDLVTRVTVVAVHPSRGSMVVRRADGVAVRIPIDQVTVHDLPPIGGAE